MTLSSYTIHMLQSIFWHIVEIRKYVAVQMKKVKKQYHMKEEKTKI